MRKFLSIFLVILLVLSTSVSVFAIQWSDITLDYSLTCDGKHSKTVPTDTVITVEYAVDNITNNEDFSVYVIQNEIYYDHHFFELVQDSFDLEIGTATAKLQKPEGENNKLTHEIYINDRVTQQYKNHQVVARFKLKVIAESGSSTVKSTSTKAYADGNTMYRVSDSLSHLTITVGEHGTDPEMPKHTLTFDTNGGSTIASIEKAKGTMVNLSSYTPTRSGYDFVGWFADEALTSKITSVMLDSNKTVYAKWEYKNTDTPGGSGTTKHTLAFDTNGGSEIEKVQKSKGSTIDLSKYIPKKEGYTFDGWYTDKELTNKVTEIKLSSDITIYAKWIEDDNKPVDKPNYKPEILSDEHYAYITGTENGMIYPQRNLTRAEAATIFFRLLVNDVRKEYMTDENIFDDVNNSDWFNTAVSTLTKLGILQGRTANTFAPNDPITRAEFTAIVTRLSQTSYTGEDLFADIEKHWAKDYINTAASINWVVGENGLFRPDDNITRAEVMALVNRILNRQPQTTADLMDGMIVWSDNSDEDAWYYIDVQEATNSHDYEMKDDGVHEKWTNLTENPDWSTFEK